MMESESNAADVKQCCAAVYGSDAARFLLGESFHPGGIDLTLELAAMLLPGPNSVVLDVASGNGASAFAVAERFGCRVIGIDLNERNVTESNAKSRERGIFPRVEFMLADAEHLPFPAAAFDALLCECAFCTFPGKAAAAAEFARVLRPGGRLGISDLTRAPGPLPELDGLLAWIACIGDARPLESYEALLTNAGFSITSAIGKDDCLRGMVEQIRGKLLLADLMLGLKKLDLPGLDTALAHKFASAAWHAVNKRQLGYALVVAQLPEC